MHFYAKEVLNMRILGIDPGFAIVGIGIIEYVGNSSPDADLYLTKAFVWFNILLDDCMQSLFVQSSDAVIFCNCIDRNAKKRLFFIRAQRMNHNIFLGSERIVRFLRC